MWTRLWCPRFTKYQSIQNEILISNWKNSQFKSKGQWKQNKMINVIQTLTRNFLLFIFKSTPVSSGICPALVPVSSHVRCFSPNQRVSRSRGFLRVWISPYKVWSFMQADFLLRSPPKMFGLSSGASHQWQVDSRNVLHLKGERLLMNQEIKHWSISKDRTESFLQQEAKVIRSVFKYHWIQRRRPLCNNQRWRKRSEGKKAEMKEKIISTSVHCKTSHFPFHLITRVREEQRGAEHDAEKSFWKYRTAPTVNFRSRSDIPSQQDVWRWTQVMVQSYEHADPAVSRWHFHKHTPRMISPHVTFKWTGGLDRTGVVQQREGEEPAVLKSLKSRSPINDPFHSP